MKKILLIILGVLLSVSVSALSPGPEVECCYHLIEDWEAENEEMQKECAEFNLTEEKCKPLMEGFGKLSTWYAEELEKAAYMRDAKRALGGASVIAFFLIVWYLLNRKKKGKKRK